MRLPFVGEVGTPAAQRGDVAGVADAPAFADETDTTCCRRRASVCPALPAAQCQWRGTAERCLLVDGPDFRSMRTATGYRHQCPAAPPCLPLRRSGRPAQALAVAQETRAAACQQFQVALVRTRHAPSPRRVHRAAGGQFMLPVQSARRRCRAAYSAGAGWRRQQEAMEKAGASSVTPPRAACSCPARRQRHGGSQIEQVDEACVATEPLSPADRPARPPR